MESEKIFQLLQTGEWEQALPYLREYLQAEATEEEKGLAYTMLAQAYIKAKTDMNNQESESITAALEILESIDKQEKVLGEAQELAATRAKLE